MVAAANDPDVLNSVNLTLKLQIISCTDKNNRQYKLRAVLPETETFAWYLVPLCSFLHPSQKHENFSGLRLCAGT